MGCRNNNKICTAFRILIVEVVGVPSERRFKGPRIHHSEWYKRVDIISSKRELVAILSNKDWKEVENGIRSRPIDDANNDTLYHDIGTQWQVAMRQCSVHMMSKDSMVLMFRWAFYSFTLCFK